MTGAASGLARAVALKLAALGADLCIVDLNAAALDATANDARSLGCAVEPVATDLARPENCILAVDRAIARFGRLDALCNIAGVLSFSPFTQVTAAQLHTTLAVNFSAPFFLSQAAIPHLLATNGAIVNVASAAAFIGEAYLAAYAASKAALVSLTKSLAMEYAKTSLRVSAVAPGGMETGMGAEIGGFKGDLDVGLIQRYSGLRGRVSVDDVAEMIALLASEQSGAFHGGCVHMDAGISAG
ncbi:SDR family oxidoreductase [Phenylobacterium sp.]|uniref:SDR family NAD(P)-dependent oxidoreductase n=1 Tax=Phenylobacterium sp. TaxID=1871053 RepID=UPI002F42AF6A